MLAPLPVVHGHLPPAGRGSQHHHACLGRNRLHRSTAPSPFSIRPERYSHDLISAAGEFTVNVPAAGQVHAVDYCGVVSGREIDKFAAIKLTPGPANTIRTPVIQECPLNLECKLRQTLPLGSHTLFIGEIMAVQATAGQITGDGRPGIGKSRLDRICPWPLLCAGTATGHVWFFGAQNPHATAVLTAGVP